MSDGPRPWTPSDGPSGERRHAPATLRNREPILAVLRDILPARGTVLEIASGSGEHCAYFAEQLSDLVWQPSDPDPDALASIAAWCAGCDNVAPPLRLDAAAADWPIAAADAVLCINMIHISPWAATTGLMRGAGAVLSAGAPLFLYGPFLRADRDTAPSNLAFDASLRDRDPAWGLRDLAEVETVAASAGFALVSVIDMPANNLSVVFRRK